MFKPQDLAQPRGELPTALHVVTDSVDERTINTRVNIYIVYLQIFTSQYFSSNYLHGPARTEATRAETLSKPRSTHQFNSAHFRSIVRHLSIISNSGLIQNPSPAVTKFRVAQKSALIRKFRLTDREQGVLRPARGHTGQSATHKPMAPYTIGARRGGA
jgi:hypothetical protein